ncbi:Wadjet anti-phage system protein JetD domain-containing protein [Oceanobacillus massiliensis]|uniref:Wadjet anti-phage system protein JetD domain-containing protein n=1 Tax=Oceanobacillus massiliensis TaxID=1465765 RepID=UPI00028A0963|nr:Wadjet anti-phage system protein JetD domain-containing protein [Oceanobacillus massiliensis]
MKEMKEALALYPKKTIDINTLQELFSAFFDSYEAFAEEVLALENAGILLMMKSKGRSTRQPSIALHYRIQSATLKKVHHHLLQQYRIQFHSAINLDYYYQHDPKQWHEDLPYLQQIDQYIKRHGFPIEAIPAPERSYEIVGDEKWITEKKGKELLERVQLFNKLQVIPVSEPLQFAINPDKIQHSMQMHLVVENKTTYQGLLPSIKQTSFATLIYGRGKGIIQSMEQFDRQYPVTASHHFFYFGDIDREGIAIWHSLTKKVEMQLALPFYRACLERQPAQGKDYQRQRLEAEEAFFQGFNKAEQSQLKDLLEAGYYYPQETLKTKELQKIWEGSHWNDMI